MIIELKNFNKILFKNFNIKNHIKKFSLHKLLNVNIDDLKNIKEKKKYDPYRNVKPSITEPFQPELDDLSRLHWLVLNRKVTTIMEFGIGKSTVIFDNALSYNRKKYENFIKNNLRRSNSFECHSIDNYSYWINYLKRNNKFKNTKIYKSDVITSTFNDRLCTYYKKIPNICPDFIYIDGPDQTSAKGDLRGLSTNHPDRLPMSADILTIEHFLLPGTLVVLDGRTANARFLMKNFQRDWIYFHDVKADQHFFELSETPLGIYNDMQIRFSLGKSFYSRLNNN